MIVNDIKTFQCKTHVKLKALIRVPSQGRIKHGMKMICDACGNKIEDSQFLIGFADNHHNMMFHEDCVDSEDKAVLLK